MGYCEEENGQGNFSCLLIIRINKIHKFFLFMCSVVSTEGRSFLFVGLPVL